MKKKLVASLIISMLLIVMTAVPVVADEEGSVTASVTVSELISITITDSGTAGINYGTLAPGTNDNLEDDANDTTPSITVNVASECNVNVDLQIYGTDFSGTFTVDNAKYSTTYAGTKYAMSTTNTTFLSDVAPGSSQDIWHWLDIPSGTTAGMYSSTFSYKAIKN